MKRRCRAVARVFMSPPKHSILLFFFVVSPTLLPFSVHHNSWNVGINKTGSFGKRCKSYIPFNQEFKYLDKKWFINPILFQRFSLHLYSRHRSVSHYCGTYATRAYSVGIFCHNLKAPTKNVTQPHKFFPSNFLTIYSMTPFSLYFFTSFYRNNANIRNFQFKFYR